MIPSSWEDGLDKSEWWSENRRTLMETQRLLLRMTGRRKGEIGEVE